MGSLRKLIHKIYDSVFNNLRAKNPSPSLFLSPILLVLLMGSVAEAVGGREVSPERLGQLVHPQREDTGLQCLCHFPELLGESYKLTYDRVP